eukprot:349919-Chlamydomonas_euryale.AAC.2
MCAAALVCSSPAPPPRPAHACLLRRMPVNLLPPRPLHACLRQPSPVHPAAAPALRPPRRCLHGQAPATSAAPPAGASAAVSPPRVCPVHRPRRILRHFFANTAPPSMPGGRPPPLTQGVPPNHDPDSPAP